MKKPLKTNSALGIRNVLFFWLLFCGTVSAHAQGVWRDTNQWDENWENRYSEWVHVTADNLSFFNELGMKIDCADVVYAYRWIFARINGLPAMASIDAKSRFSNRTTRPEWAKLPTAVHWRDDKRFLRALEFLANNKGTINLKYDGYPIAINTKSMTPGVFYLFRDKHAQLVRAVDFTDPNTTPMELVQGTTPRSRQDLTRIHYWSAEQPTHSDAGFMKFRTPVVSKGTLTYRPVIAEPHYSIEQSRPGLLSNWMNNKTDLSAEIKPTFTGYVYDILKPNLDRSRLITNGIDEVVKLFAVRKEMAEKGFEICKGVCDPNGQLFDDWSTPTRDQRLRDLFKQVASDVGNARFLGENIHHYWYNCIYNTTAVVIDDKPITLHALWVIWVRENIFSSNPNDPIAKRWGLDQYELSQSPTPKPEKSCSNFDPLIQTVQ
jgi:hypothetical protein